MTRRYHRGSLFGSGPRIPLDREKRARFRFLLTSHRRSRRISPLAFLTGEALLKRHGVDGRLDPSQGRLADDVGCSDRTIRRALGVLRSLGLVAWVCRLIRDGWAVRQTSNAYVLNVAERDMPMGVAATDKVTVQPETRIKKDKGRDALEAALARLGAAIGQQGAFG
jgi:DNA-binding GntR family transcriptional regulator